MALLNKLKGLIGLDDSAPEDESQADFEQRAQKFVTEKWMDIKNAYWVYHQRLWECRLYYAGQFWFEFNPQRKTFTEVTPKDDWIPQPRLNRFSPAVDAIASNFGQIPEVEAVATPKDDEKALGICEVVNELSKFCIKDNALRSDYKNDEDKAGYAATEFVLSGCCYTITYPEDVKVGQKPKMAPQPAFGYQCPRCDTYQSSPVPVISCPTCGTPVLSQPTETVAPVIGPDGQPEMEDVIRKKVVVKLGDPGHSFPRLGARNMRETPYHFWAERMTLDEIYQRWGQEVTANNEQPDGFSVAYDYALHYWMVGFNAANFQGKDGALVVECYIEPNEVKDLPEGLYAVMVNDKLIHCEPWPFVEHPLTKGDYTQLPTLFFPRSVSFDLVELQREKCQYESMIALHAKTTAADTLVIDEDSVVTRPTGRSDKVIYVRLIAPGAMKPHYLEHGKLDPEIYKKLDYIDAQFDIVSAVSAVFRGEQPGSVTAAAAIETLRGQAEFRFAKPLQNWNNLWRETIRKAIKNYQKHWTIEQFVEVLGQDRMQQIEDFRQANLDTCCDFIATNTGLPRTRDERRKEMIALYDKGMIDPADPNVRQKMFELFGETGMMKTFNDDARRARINVRRIKEGMPSLNMFRPGIDDTQTHMAIALESAKSLDFDKWPLPSQQELLIYIESVRAQLIAEMPPPPVEGPPPKEKEAPVA